MKRSGRIPQETIDEILRRADMVAVISRYTALKKRGSNFLGLCPFHGEKTPSFTVNPDKGVFHCFGCQKGGTLFGFLQEIENRSFVETVVALGEEVGIKVEQDEELSPADIRRKRLFDILERTATYYHELLLKSPTAREALSYLSGRRINAQTIERFRLGWAPASGRALLSKLEQSGVDREEAAAVGVIRERQGSWSDALRARVTFPIFDTQDRIVAFGGRVIDDSQPKYLNSPETELYSKRKLLYGLNLHRQAIAKSEQALVVEGYLDVIMLDQVGLRTAVASLGTALTPEQAQLLRRYTKDVVLAYDADKAGQNATVKGIELFEQAGLRVQILPLQPGEDPDSLARKGGSAALEQALGSAVGVVDYFIEQAQKKFNLNRPEGKEDFARLVLPLVSKIVDRVRNDAYVVKVARLLGVTEQQVLWKVRGQQHHTQIVQKQESRRRLPGPEVMLFRVCLHYPECLNFTEKKLELQQLASPEMRALFGALFACRQANPASQLTLQDLLLHIEVPGSTFPQELSGPATVDMEPLVSDPDQESPTLQATTRDDLEKILVKLMMQEPPASNLEDAEKLVKSIQERSLDVELEELRREMVPRIERGDIDREDPKFQRYILLSKQLKGTP